MKLVFAMLLPVFAAGQLLDPALLTKTLGESWPTYSGDYSGKRYSGLSQINQSNVGNLTLAWVNRATPGAAGANFIGGEGAGEAAGPSFGGGTNVRGSILEVDGILYYSMPDNAWAADARDGH